LKNNHGRSLLNFSCKKKKGLLRSVFAGKKKVISPEEQLLRAAVGDKESIAFFESTSVTKDHTP
jgi:hypothetical protein